MRLALLNRVDTDLTHLILIDDAPTGDPVLDTTLADIAKSEDRRDARSWVETAPRGTPG